MTAAIAAPFRPSTAMQGRVKMMPTQLDRTLEPLLEQWQVRIAALSQALLKLENLPTYRAISNKSAPTATETKLLQSSYPLFEQFDQLVKVVEQAQQLHHDNRGLLRTQRKTQAAINLLQDKSLELSPELASVLIPGLASASASASTSAHSPGDPLRAGKTGLNSQAGSPANLQGTFQTTRLSRKLNPISPSRITPKQLLKHFLAQYQQTLDGLQQLEQAQEREAQERTAAIAQSQALCQQLTQHYTVAQALQSNYRQKITRESETLSCPEAPSETQIQTLMTQGEQLSQALQAPASTEELAPFKQWHIAAEEMLYQLELLQAFCQQQLNLRQELRGRLGAMQAKALARGQVEAISLTNLGQKAERLLYSQATPLGQSQQLLQQYEQTLNQLLKG